MTIFVTRWALQNGAIVRYDDAEATVVRGAKGNRHCAVVRSHKGGRKIRFWPGEWHPTEAAARTRAEELRQGLLDSFARQADKLAMFKFRVTGAEPSP